MPLVFKGCDGNDLIRRLIGVPYGLNGAITCRNLWPEIVDRGRLLRPSHWLNDL